MNRLLQGDVGSGIAVVAHALFTRIKWGTKVLMVLLRLSPGST